MALGAPPMIVDKAPKCGSAFGIFSRASWEGSGPGGIRSAWGQGAEREQNVSKKVMILSVCFLLGVTAYQVPVFGSKRNRYTRFWSVAVRILPKPNRRWFQTAYATHHLTITSTFRGYILRTQ